MQLNWKKHPNTTKSKTKVNKHVHVRTHIRKSSQFRFYGTSCQAVVTSTRVLILVGRVFEFAPIIIEIIREIRV